MRRPVLFLALLFIVFPDALVSAERVEPGEFGVLYNCGFPAEDVKLDGQFSEIFWTVVPWDKVTHEMGWGDLPKSDEDGSYEFACVADKDYLYVGMKVYDDDKVVDEDTGASVYEDDCMEIYIDGGNEKLKGDYDLNDTQIMIGRENVGNKDCPGNPKLAGNHWKAGNYLKGADTGTEAFAVDTNYGWALEAAVPLDTFEIVLANGTVIGFNVQLNDDDDGGTRDHKLSWSEKEREGAEASYQDASVFGELKFVEADLAVSAKGKLATTWASVKK